MQDYTSFFVAKARQGIETDLLDYAQETGICMTMKLCVGILDPGAIAGKIRKQ